METRRCTRAWRHPSDRCTCQAAVERRRPSASHSSHHPSAFCRCNWHVNWRFSRELSTGCPSGRSTGEGLGRTCPVPGGAEVPTQTAVAGRAPKPDRRSRTTVIRLDELERSRRKFRAYRRVVTKSAVPDPAFRADLALAGYGRRWDADMPLQVLPSGLPTGCYHPRRLGRVWECRVAGFGC